MQKGAQLSLYGTQSLQMAERLQDAAHSWEDEELWGLCVSGYTAPVPQPAYKPTGKDGCSTAKLWDDPAFLFTPATSFCT